MLLKRGQGHYIWPLVKTENRKQRRECKSKFKFNLCTKAILKQFKKNIKIQVCNKRDKLRSQKIY